MDILICIIKYPNDPTEKLNAHQHFVGYFSEEKGTLYSISSIAHKEFKVYLRDGSVNPDYFVLTGEKQNQCRLRFPSFIDCTKAYHLYLNDSIDLHKLSHRSIPSSVREELERKIEGIKKSGKHTEFSISIEEFLKYNPKSRKSE